MQAISFCIIIIIIIIVVVVAAVVVFVVAVVVSFHRLQGSDCNSFRIMCDVESIAVLCSQSIECFPGMATKFFLKPLLLFRWLQLLPV